LENAKNNIWGEILCKIKLEKDVKGLSNIKFPEPLTKEDLISLYNKYTLN